MDRRNPIARIARAHVLGFNGTIAEENDWRSMWHTLWSGPRTIHTHSTHAHMHVLCVCVPFDWILYFNWCWQCDRIWFWMQPLTLHMVCSAWYACELHVSDMPSSPTAQQKRFCGSMKNDIVKMPVSNRYKSTQIIALCVYKFAGSVSTVGAESYCRGAILSPLRDDVGSVRMRKTFVSFVDDILFKLMALLIVKRLFRLPLFLFDPRFKCHSIFHMLFPRVVGKTARSRTVAVLMLLLLLIDRG